MSDDEVQVLEISKNEIGWDWRRIVWQWLWQVREALIYEPYLNEWCQRESLAFLFDTLRTGGLGRVVVCTTEQDGEADSAALAGLQGMQACWSRLGLELEIQLRAFHRRRLIVEQAGGVVVELTLGHGLHCRRRPHTEVARASLAASRTRDQYVAVHVRRAEHADQPLACPPAPAERRLQPARLRCLLHDIDVLKGRQQAGMVLWPAQVAKVAREVALRASLAEAFAPQAMA